MYCTNCGANIPEGVSFCTHCGTKVETPVKTVSENPYASVNSQNTPANNSPQSFAQPYAQNYTQPQTQAYVQPQTQNYQQGYPQNYGQNYSQPQQNFPNTPQYMRPVQTPQGVQYMPVEPVVHAPAPAPRHNLFTFISAGIAGLMFILCFLPWFTVDNSGFNLFRVFSDNIYLELFEMDAVAVCSFIMISAMGLLIPFIILTFLRKNRLPIGLAIAASAITLFTLFLFLVLVADSKGNVEATAVPVMMLFLSVANIVFPAIARKV